MPHPITVIIATKNEVQNISKCIRSISNEVERIIVVDSESTDNTQEVAVRLGAEVLNYNVKSNYPKKRQWALNNCNITSKWTLILDADEEFTDVLWLEVARFFKDDRYSAAFISKGFHFMGRKFRFGGFSHSALILFKTGSAHFENLGEENITDLDMEVHERVIFHGQSKTLTNALIHNDYKGLTSYIDRHNKYSTWEALIRFNFLKSGSYGEDAIQPKFFGNTQEFRRFIKFFLFNTSLEPVIWFIYHYFFRLGFLEGKRGWIACRLRANYICDVKAKLIELAEK